MCTSYIKIKSVSEYGIKYAYLPCGKCPDCRRRIQSAWRFRMNAEFLSLRKLGWNMAFCTLTYSNENLPHVPKVLFKDKKDFKDVRCFSRSDVRNWILSIRDYCKYHYAFVGDKRIRYFVTSEYGSHTKRPHYHALLAWPADMSYEDMHALCKSSWKHGFLFPRYASGDFDMLPFALVGDITKAMRYVSKYICKDLDWLSEFDNIELNTDTRLYKECAPFHVQSRSLGFEYIAQMADDDKWRVFLDGINFQGDGLQYKMPVYMKNKLIFDNDYVISNDGRRLVRRRVTDFFRQHKTEIFDKKVEFYSRLFRDSTSVDYFKSRGCDSTEAESFVRGIDKQLTRLNYALGFDLAQSNYIGAYFMCYFAVPSDKCKVVLTHDDAVDQWFQRYESTDLLADVPAIDSTSYASLQSFFSLVLGCNTFCNLKFEAEQAQKDALSRRIQDYFNNFIRPHL